ncbi:MAG: pyridoxamine 5'-phosphate oxidase family protein [Anaerolineae bacterium]|nr:pyridoxamine 5'-phosphate oxidase family protein [Anaerolineae bacterium]
MILQLPSELVWKVLKQELFAVLGMVTDKGEARTVGVVYAVHDQKLYLTSGKDTWKVHHMSRHPHVSMTVPIAKRIPFLPWIKIPSATITFAGMACVESAQNVSQEILQSLLRGLQMDAETLAGLCVIEIEPVGDFVTYGVGVPMMTMRHPDQSRGRAPVSVSVKPA